MTIDGKAVAEGIAASVRERVAALPNQPKLSVITCAPTFATKRFLDIKRAQAEAIGVAVVLTELPAACDTDAAIRAVNRATATSDGVIVQLPFPPHIDIERVLASLRYLWDVDAIGSEAQHRLAAGTALVLPPVVAAIRAIADAHGLVVSGKRVVVVGEGRLVGKPAAEWARHQGAEVTTLDRETTDLAAHTRQADVLILGAGVPGLVTPDMIHEGVALFDAGTSEDAGKLVGDADPACAQKAALFTPVPGGIGPVTIAVIFDNLLTLIAERNTGAAST